MSVPAPRAMPVIEAWPLGGVFEGHYEARFPEGFRTYPSAKATVAAAMRIGSAVHFRPTSLSGAGISPSRPRTEAHDASPAAYPPRRSTQPVPASADPSPG